MKLARLGFVLVAAAAFCMTAAAQEVHTDYV